MSISPTRTLLFINVMAMAGLAFLWVDQSGHLRQISWKAPSQIKAVLDTPSQFSLPLSSDPAPFGVTLERPLFTPDRRPPPPILPPPPPDPLADAQLLGLVAGKSGSVLIRSEGSVRRVNLDQKIGEWTLQAIAERTATFSRADEKRTIRLEYSRLGVPAATTAKQPISATSGAVGAQGNSAAAQRQMAAEEAKNRDLAAMRSRMP